MNPTCLGRSQDAKGEVDQRLHRSDRREAPICGALTVIHAHFDVAIF
jgi:hypothetical protein